MSSIQETATSAVEATKDYVIAAQATMKPHVDSAVAAAQPHIERAKEAAQEYLGTGKDKRDVPQASASAPLESGPTMYPPKTNGESVKVGESKA